MNGPEAIQGESGHIRSVSRHLTCVASEGLVDTNCPRCMRSALMSLIKNLVSSLHRGVFWGFAPRQS